MILNGVELNILAHIELIDAYNDIYPDNFIYKNVIYCVHNKVNNKNYVGQTIDFKNRFSESYIGHFKDYKKYINGKLGDNRILYKAWKKYGLESFIVYIIDLCDDRDSLNEKEMYWIKTLHTCTKDDECLGYNLSWGADDMGVKNPESIEKSLKTRKEKYGEYLANCHTPEAYSKGNKTKIERYGHGGFINASTPEANEKRRKTNLERYGTLHGGKISKEAMENMINKKIEKYGDPMGSCNTPENRKKAIFNKTITYLFRFLESFVSENGIVSGFKNFCKIALSNPNTRREISLKRVERLIENVEALKKDKRWTPFYEKLLDFSEISYALSTVTLVLKELRSESHKRKTLEIINKGLLTKKLIKINKIIKSFPEIKTFDDFVNYSLKEFTKVTKGKYFINSIIDSLPRLKVDDRWTPELDKIFLGISEKDKLKFKGHVS